MITGGGYTIMQSVNKIEIYLPQTVETIHTTVAPIAKRKNALTAEEEAYLLLVVKLMMEETTEWGDCQGTVVFEVLKSRLDKAGE